MKKTNPNFLNGVPELVVLRLLNEREMYGYEIVRSIEGRSNGYLSFAEGCIYPVLHGLEERRLVKSLRRTVDGRSRLYYRLAAKGRMRLTVLEGEWRDVTVGIDLLLGGRRAAS
jgi:PadR family transcriptional regulator PadR